MKKVLLSAILISFNFIFSQSQEQTYVPDDNFEQALVDLGYDDVLDDYVLTANIDNVDLLRLSGKSISSLEGIEDFAGLKVLAAGANSLVNVDLSNNDNLEIVDLDENLLEELILPSSQTLKNLEVRENKLLESIDVSSLAFLESLNIGNTNISALDLSNNSLLQQLLCFNTPIELLDLSFNPELKGISGENMANLKLLNLRSGGNTNLDGILFLNSPNLSCIQVDDREYAQQQENWVKDDTAQYSEDCSLAMMDSDSDGVSDDLDLCPNTPNGQNVNAQGCSLSQYADIAVHNVSVGLGSFLCSEPQNCTVDIAVNRDVAIAVSVIKDDTETVFDGIISINSPLALENLTAGQYRVCATRTDIPNFVQCYDVSSTETENSISTNIVMQNPGQTYTLMVEGNTKYEVLVNGISTTYEFADVDKQSLEIPLEVGANSIQVIGTIECDNPDVQDAVEDTVVAMEKDETEDSLMLFPTLSDGLITFENNKRHAIHGISISSLNGVETKFMPIADNPKKIEIDMRGKAKGMYIVRIQRASGEVNLMKIVIQ